MRAKPRFRPWERVSLCGGGVPLRSALVDWKSGARLLRARVNERRGAWKRASWWNSGSTVRVSGAWSSTRRFRRPTSACPCQWPMALENERVYETVGASQRLCEPSIFTRGAWSSTRSRRPHRFDDRARPADRGRWAPLLIDSQAPGYGASVSMNDVAPGNEFSTGTRIIGARREGVSIRAPTTVRV